MKYNLPLNIDRVLQDIRLIRVQGATNIAIKVIQTLRDYILSYDGTDIDIMLGDFRRIGLLLSNCRPNEPLSRNAVKYIDYLISQHTPKNIDNLRILVNDSCSDYLSLIMNSKKRIIENAFQKLRGKRRIFTICHSSTVVAILGRLSQEGDDFEVFVSETRPLYQGRNTAQELSNMGIKTTLYVDSATSSFFNNINIEQPDAAIIGCDEIYYDGSCLNKIGSWQLARLCKDKEIEFVVATSLLKYTPERERKVCLNIEVRPGEEIWSDKPASLNIFNPAFDFIDTSMISFFLTEKGFLTSGELENAIRELYPWILLGNND